MNLEILQNPEVKKNNYDDYKAAGGIFNEKDYISALTRAKDNKIVNSYALMQIQSMARVANIVLRDSRSEIDPRVALYVALRGDIPDPKEEIYYDRMSDQRLFAEVLRVLGDTESLRKFVAAYPNIFSEGK